MKQNNGTGFDVFTEGWFQGQSQEYLAYLCFQLHKENVVLGQKIEDIHKIVGYGDCI